MTTRTPLLTDRDHGNMDAFLGHVLDAYKAGEITRVEAVGGLVRVIAAIDGGNYGEAVNWVEQGRKLIIAGR